jgi:hypothetical protein
MPQAQRVFPVVQASPSPRGASFSTRSPLVAQRMKHSREPSKKKEKGEPLKKHRKLDESVPPPSPEKFEFDSKELFDFGEKSKTFVTGEKEEVDERDIWDGVRIVEVGGGTGAFASFICESNREIIDLSEMMLATDNEPLKREDTLAFARKSKIKCLGRINADNLYKVVPKKGSIDLIISANPYYYGLRKFGSLDTSFVYSACQTLKPNGTLVMLLRSNLLFWHLQACKKSEDEPPFTNTELKKHNNTAVKVYDGKLSTTNRYGTDSWEELQTICTNFKLYITVSRVIPPEGVEFTAFADKQYEKVETLHGFNVQVLFTKVPEETWNGDERYQRPWYVESKPFWTEISSYLVGS